MRLSQVVAQLNMIIERDKEDYEFDELIVTKERALIVKGDDTFVIKYPASSTAVNEEKFKRMMKVVERGTYGAPKPLMPVDIPSTIPHIINSLKEESIGSFKEELGKASDRLNSPMLTDLQKSSLKKIQANFSLESKPLNISSEKELFLTLAKELKEISKLDIPIVTAHDMSGMPDIPSHLRNYSSGETGISTEILRPRPLFTDCILDDIASRIEPFSTVRLTYLNNKFKKKEDK